jgi:hypothetical protein
MKKGLILVIFTFLLMSYHYSAAEENGKSMAEKIADVAFSEIERQMIKKYYGKERDSSPVSSTKGKKGKGLPPGLAKRDSLPPGLAMQLQRNGTLPPGLAKRALPADLESQLPPVKKGYQRSILEDLTIVLIEEATGRIADIIIGAATENM